MSPAGRLCDALPRHLRRRPAPPPTRRRPRSPRPRQHPKKSRGVLRGGTCCGCSSPPPPTGTACCDGAQHARARTRAGAGGATDRAPEPRPDAAAARARAGVARALRRGRGRQLSPCQRTRAVLERPRIHAFWRHISVSMMCAFIHAFTHPSARKPAAAHGANADSHTSGSSEKATSNTRMVSAPRSSSTSTSCVMASYSVWPTPASERVAHVSYSAFTRLHTRQRRHEQARVARACLQHSDARDERGSRPRGKAGRLCALVPCAQAGFGPR